MSNTKAAATYHGDQPDLAALRARAERILEYADTYGDRMVVPAADLLTILDQLDTPATPEQPYVDVVFDGPPAHESGRFVECEAPDGSSMNAGEWIDRGNGLHALRIRLTAEPQPAHAEPESRARRDAHLAHLMDDDEATLNAHGLTRGGRDA